MTKSKGHVFRYQNTFSYSFRYENTFFLQFRTFRYQNSYSLLYLYRLSRYSMFSPSVNSDQDRKREETRLRTMSYVLTTLTKKKEIDSIIRDTIDKVLVLRFGRASDAVCLQLDDTVSFSSRISLSRTVVESMHKCKLSLYSFRNRRGRCRSSPPLASSTWIPRTFKCTSSISTSA